MVSTNAFAGALCALADCLEAEYRALLAEDIGQLQAALGRKQQLLMELAARPAAVGAAPGSRGQATALSRRALARMREMNRRNAQVLAPRAAALGARLRFLQAAVGRDSVYAADGSLMSGVFRAAHPQSV